MNYVSTLDSSVSFLPLLSLVEVKCIVGFLAPLDSTPPPPPPPPAGAFVSIDVILRLTPMS